jgi:hypothetical protein
MTQNSFSVVEIYKTNRTSLVERFVVLEPPGHVALDSAHFIQTHRVGIDLLPMFLQKVFDSEVSVFLRNYIASVSTIDNFVNFVSFRIIQRVKNPIEGPKVKTKHTQCHQTIASRARRL